MVLPAGLYSISDFALALLATFFSGSVDFVQQKTTFRYFFFFFPYFAVQYRTVNVPASRDFSTFLFSFFKGSNNTTAWDPGKRVGHLFQFR